MSSPRCCGNRRRGELQCGTETAFLSRPGLCSQKQHPNYGWGNSFYRHGHGTTYNHIYIYGGRNCEILNHNYETSHNYDKTSVMNYEILSHNYEIKSYYLKLWDKKLCYEIWNEIISYVM